MSHPTPDLQAIQGAYVGNIERLEQHAERLSFSSDLAEGLRRLNSQQRRHDSNNLPSPPQFSPSGHHVRPHTVSGLTLADHLSTSLNPQDGVAIGSLGESVFGSPIQSSVSLFGLHDVRSETSALRDVRDSTVDHLVKPAAASEFGRLYEDAASNVHRNLSVVSSNTLQQAKDAFAEFDGTHAGESEYHIDSNAFDARPSGVSFEMNRMEPKKAQADMVYYPAPIPVMLSLPPKLSKRRHVSKLGNQNRHTLIDDKLEPAAQNEPAQHLPKDQNAGEEDHIQSMTPMPSHRTVNFSQEQTTSPKLQLQHDSAVETLDSMLDASVYAPVGAFTDHPIVGPSGAEIYRSAGDSKSRDSISNQLSERTGIPHKGYATPSLRTMIPALKAATPESQTSAEHEGQADESAWNDAGSEAVLDTAKPTTLLAELETRKKQQQSRNRTAADAFPKGMHATLLQLDSVAQRQRENRKTKHITLVWEATPAADEDILRDEDTPLALLARPQNTDVSGDAEETLGLLERRQLEDNEPLSARRARLTGAMLSNPISQSHPEETNRIPSRVEGGDREESEDQEETLGQRRRRLRLQGAIPAERAVSGELTTEMLGEFGILAPQLAKSPHKARVPRPLPEDDEPLAQRRQRLRGGISATIN